MATPLLTASRKRWLWLFLVFTVIALVNNARFATNQLTAGEPGRWQFYFIMETTGAYTVLLLLPALLWFFAKYPLTRPNLAPRLPLYLLASMAFGACHTLLMFSSRTLIFWMAGKGAYDYGHWGYRFLMEYTHQFITFWIIYGVDLFVRYVRENQQQKLKSAQLEQQLTQARLQALQMQLNPHFLFNTLNLISATMFDDVNAADKMMANLGELLRKTLNSTNWQEHALKDELELAGLYVDIMKARFRDKLSVQMNIAHDTLLALVPGFILQPLLENAIHYSMSAEKSAKVEIRAHREHDSLKLSISDNGPGLAAEPEQIMNQGVGLSNTAERLAKLYGRAHLFHLHNQQEGGLQVVLEIPFRVTQSTEGTVPAQIEGRTEALPAQ